MDKKPINSWKQQEFIISAYRTHSGNRKDKIRESMTLLRDAHINLVIPCDEPTVEGELELFGILEEIGLPFLAADKPVFCEKRIGSDSCYGFRQAE